MIISISVNSWCSTMDNFQYIRWTYITQKNKNIKVFKIFRPFLIEGVRTTLGAHTYKIVDAPWHKEQEQEIWFRGGDLNNFQDIYHFLLEGVRTTPRAHDLHTIWYVNTQITRICKVLGSGFKLCLGYLVRSNS